MKPLIFISLLLLAGCGRAGVDPVFDSYISSFESSAKQYASPAIVDYGVQFGSPQEHGCNAGDAGCCDVGLWSREVIVDKRWWENSDEPSRTAMLYHEFGHCSLGRKHTSETTTIAGPMGSTLTIPASLMNPSIVSGWDFSHNNEAYLQELFK